MELKIEMEATVDVCTDFCLILAKAGDPSRSLLNRLKFITKNLYRGEEKKRCVV